MVWNFLSSVRICEGVDIQLESGARTRRHGTWNVIPLALMWVIWKERNRRAFEGVAQDCVELQTSLFYLVSFWCTHEAPF